MMKRIAMQSNAKNRELNFVLEGLNLDINGRRIFVPAFAVPAMEMTDAKERTTTLSPEVYNRNRRKLAQNTGLADYLRQESGGRSTSLGVFHTHQEQLGLNNQKRPSSGDYAQIEQWLTTMAPDTRLWGVMTLNTTIINFMLDLKLVKEMPMGQSLIKTHSWDLQPVVNITIQVKQIILWLILFKVFE